MRSFAIGLTLFLAAAGAFAQGDRGAITGTVLDSGGAVVSGAAVEARNVQTGGVYQAATTGTGNYALSELPAGSYQLSVTVPGFKKYVRQGLTVQVAETLRIDTTLEVGSASESVTVTEAATLLKTESGELSHNVTGQRLDDLPVLSVGAAAGSTGIRNPTAVLQFVPGAYIDPNNQLKVNGAPTNTESIRVEGQDASDGYVSKSPAHVQPSVDAIQEVSIQTSNFAAEYGQVGGGFFNYTMKSGTNQLHGTVYDYFVNEAFNAATPYTVNPSSPNEHIRQAARRNDYGFTIGGAINIPKVYNGHDKTFFFFNWEQFLEYENINNQSITIPIQAYRDGNFQKALTGRTLATDPIGRNILEGTIYDPSTQRLAPNGQIIRDPFPGNTIPLASMDPVSLKIQALIPLPNFAPNALVSNSIFPYVADRNSAIPSFKIDQILGPKDKLSLYYSEIWTASKYSNTTGGADGLPEPITGAIGTYITSHTSRLNYEHTLSPVLLLHFGVGYQDNYFADDVVNTNYNSVQSLGLIGATVPRMFPEITNASNAQGGVKTLGPGTNRHIYYQKPTANSSLTWVKDNHTFKFGAEMRIEGLPTTLFAATNGIYSFSANETGLPSTQGQNIQGGTVGAPYASFLLGSVDAVTIQNPPELRLGKSQWGFFAQDTWKVNRRLTLDYGLRYDYSTYLKEQYGRVPNFSTTTPDPAAGNRLGGILFEGDGPGHCSCNFANNYPLAFGPRLGAAYQINPKTVLRAGIGLVYNGTPDNAGESSQMTVPVPVTNPAFGQPVEIFRNGLPFTPSPWPDLNPGQFPKAGTLNGPKVFYDQNAGRPARQLQWSIGIQREITKDLAVEASYVANRGAWWSAPGLIDVNAVTPQALSALGLSLNNAADISLLTSPISSAAAAARGFNKLPYAGFPTGSTVAQSLRPFPQFGTVQGLWSPLGKTWYDSLQSKVTKRLSHGLTATVAFTWQKSMTLGTNTDTYTGDLGGAAINDVFNRGQNKYISSYSQPLTLNYSVSYVLPALKLGNGFAGKAASWGVRDWSIGAYAAYASGLPILSPGAQNGVNAILLRNTTASATGTYANRVPGVPLYTVDIDCHCYDPNKTFVLNPAAWTQPAAGQWGTAAAYYSDYRYQRRPIENLGVGRTFHIKERASVNIRAEFSNVFNRARVNDPVVANALATQTKTATGQTTGGFGWINTSFGTAGAVTAPQLPRGGSVVARLTF